jgi:hypothetical protein
MAAVSNATSVRTRARSPRTLQIRATKLCESLVCILVGCFIRSLRVTVPDSCEPTLATSLYSGHVAALFLCVEAWRTRRRVASLLAQKGRFLGELPVKTT